MRKNALLLAAVSAVALMTMTVPANAVFVCTVTDGVKVCENQFGFAPGADVKSGASDQQIDHVIERVRSMGHEAHLSRGTFRTIIGVIGDESQFQPEQFQVLPGVADAVAWCRQRVTGPQRLA